MSDPGILLADVLLVQSDVMWFRELVLVALLSKLDFAPAETSDPIANPAFFSVD
jgi:hypothetical protein